MANYNVTNIGKCCGILSTLSEYLNIPIILPENPIIAYTIIGR